jgi:hypothetical protein
MQCSMAPAERSHLFPNLSIIQNKRVVSSKQQNTITEPIMQHALPCKSKACSSGHSAREIGSERFVDIATQSILKSKRGTKR